MPDIASARIIRDDLLLARFESATSFLAARTPMDDSRGQRPAEDGSVHGAQLDWSSAHCSLRGGGSLVYFGVPAPHWQIVTVIGTTLSLRSWTWYRAFSAQRPNSRLQQFDTLIDQGCILLMIDVPEHSVEEIKKLLGERHPEAQDRGLDPHIPVFP